MYYLTISGDQESRHSLCGSSGSGHLRSWQTRYKSGHQPTRGSAGGRATSKLTHVTLGRLERLMAACWLLARASFNSLPCGSVYRAAHDTEAGFHQSEQAREVRKKPSLHCILFVRNQSLGPAYTRREGMDDTGVNTGKQGSLGDTRGCLPWRCCHRIF